MARRPYPSDLTDAPWKRVKPRIPPATPGGRSRTVARREALHGFRP